MFTIKSFILLTASATAFVAAQQTVTTAGIAPCDIKAPGSNTCPLQNGQTSLCGLDPQQPNPPQYGQCGYIGIACSIDAQCQGNGHCQYPTGQTTGGQCAGYFGDPCGTGLGCLGELTCGTSADPGTIYPACGGAGATCTYAADCASQSCNMNGTCDPRQADTIFAGEPCGLNANLNNFCGASMTCSMSSFTCQPIQPPPSQAANARQRNKRNIAIARAADLVF